MNSWPSCPAVVKTQKCRVPNESRTPSKHVWSSDATMRHTLIGMLETLAFMPVACRLEIKHEIINISTMMRNGKYGRIDIEMKEYSLAKNFSKVISQVMDNLSKIFLKITLELSPCAYQAAKSLTQSQYTDSKLKNHGKCQLIHADCWHLHVSCFEHYSIDVESQRRICSLWQ